MKHSKRYRNVLSHQDKSSYTLSEAIEKVKETATCNFDESVEVALRLGVDPKKQDQMIRGSVELPYGTGKKIRILVIAKGEKEKEAKDAGAEYIGGEEYIEKIGKGWFDFDSIIATPDMMPKLAKLGRILGPKGLMPSPKTNTVTFDVGAAVKSLRKGKINFKTDRTGNIHVMVGKTSFDKEKLEKNIIAFLSEVIHLRPSGLKGQYLKGVTISSTMGPGFTLGLKELSELLREK